MDKMELIGKSMRVKTLYDLLGLNFDLEKNFLPSVREFKGGSETMLISVDVKEHSHTNIFFKFTNSVDTYEYLLKNNQIEKLYVKIINVEFWKE